MRLMDMNTTEWQQFAPYIDTLCIPISSFSLQEKQLNRLQAQRVEQITKRFEKKLMGRVLLLPPISYVGKDSSVFLSYLNEVMTDLSQLSFHYLILVIDGQYKYIEEVDLTHLSFMDSVVHMVPTIEAELDEAAKEEMIDQEIMKLYNKTLKIWQTNI
ncbi:DUF2487 family protein [Thermoflavimicrobium daqui]|nr:DUF2487 family protein [Thermoflavimicrobium daqui]